MALKRGQLSPRVKERLAAIAAEMREILYGEAGHPEWGTLFTEFEADGMAVGLELARLTVEQALGSQAKETPPEAWSVPDQEVQPAGRKRRMVRTDSGEVVWDEPRGYLKTARRAFSPSGEGAGDGCREHALADAGAESRGAGDASVVVS
jgi:hypothetical protein